STDARAWKRLLKPTIFLLISCFISNTLMAYLIGVVELVKIITAPISEHLFGSTSIVIFTFLFYAVFTHVREIGCTTICPYGRFQGVLLDDQSMSVAYNVDRGEPRGKLTKQEESKKGDCVDCGLCVHVCPTGIDIRDGVQLECVNCTACIDACDAVMHKIGKPTRLIGFYSLGEVEGKKDFKKSPNRPILYTLILVILCIVFFYLIFNRAPIDGSLLRATGSTYQTMPDGRISNLYTIELINKSGQTIPFEMKASDPNYELQLVNKIDSLAKDGTAKLSFFLIANKDKIETYKTKTSVQILSEGKEVNRLKTTFICPPGSKK